jgi:hypothetical protein
MAKNKKKNFDIKVKYFDAPQRAKHDGIKNFWISLKN